MILSNQARNFPGRNGHPDVRPYLASTITVAASTLAADPRELPAA